MYDELLQVLKEILDDADQLFKTELNDTQQGFIDAAYEAAQEMVTMVVSFPEIALERSREVFSYEARSLLASIIGYAELLLDEDDGILTGDQRRLTEHIRASGKKLLRVLPQILG